MGVWSKHTKTAVRGDVCVPCLHHSPMLTCNVNNHWKTSSTGRKFVRSLHHAPAPGGDAPGWKRGGGERWWLPSVRCVRLLRCLLHTDVPPTTHLARENSSPQRNHTRVVDTQHCAVWRGELFDNFPQLPFTRSLNGSLGYCSLHIHSSLSSTTAYSYECSTRFSKKLWNHAVTRRLRYRSARSCWSGWRTT